MATEQSDHDKLMKALEENEPHTESIKQISPCETPTTVLSLKGYMVDLNTLLAEQLRAAGGQVLTNKAPRGNLARKLGSGKGKGKGKK